MFQVVARHWELIFFLLTSPKFELGEVEKPIFQGFACYIELIFGVLTIPKWDLVEFEKQMFQDIAWHLQLIFGLWNCPKCKFGEFVKATFVAVQDTENSFPASWPAQNAISLKSKKRCFKLSNGTVKSFSTSLPCHFELVFGLLTIP